MNPTLCGNKETTECLKKAFATTTTYQKQKLATIMRFFGILAAHSEARVRALADTINDPEMDRCQRASCATYGLGPYMLRHEWLSTDEARLRTMQRHWDDLKRVAQQELTLSTFHTGRSLIRLVFITSHLVYYSTMPSLDL